MFNMPLHMFIDELKPKDLWSLDIYDIKETGGKSFCMFHEKRCYKTNNYRAFKYYLEEPKINKFLDDYPKLEKIIYDTRLTM